SSCLTLLVLVAPGAARADATHSTATTPTSCVPPTCVGSAPQSDGRAQRTPVSREDASTACVAALLLVLLVCVLVIVTLQRPVQRPARAYHASARSCAPQPPIRLAQSRSRDVLR